MNKVIINQNQIGVLVRNGQVAQVLTAGVYRTYSFRNESIVIYPGFSQSCAYVLNVRTAEAAAVSVDVTIGATIKDAKKLHLSGKTVYEVINRAITSQLQAVAEAKSLSELLECGLSIDGKALASDITEYGLTASVELLPKVRLPRNLQNAIDAQEVARQRAKAELEEARGRSAVIRHYANVAKVTKDNPDLLRLLLGQKAKSINVAFDATGRSK